MSAKPLLVFLETIGNSAKPKSDKETAIFLIPKLIDNFLPSAFYSDNNDEIVELAGRLRYYENHIFNFYGKENREEAKKAAKIFCQTLYDSFLKALQSWNKSKSSNNGLFWNIILTLTNSTLENFIHDFTVYMNNNPEKAEIWQSMMGLSGLEFSQYESFIVKVMNVAEKPSNLTIIFGTNVCTNKELSKFLTETVLIRRIQSSTSKKRHSYLIAGYLSVVSPNLLLESFAATLQYFHLQSKNTFNDFEQQKQTAITTVDLAKVIPKEWESKANQYVSQFVPSSMPNYLRLSDASRRQLGMYVGETLIKLFPINGTDKLIFEYDEEDPMLHEVREVILEPLENGEIPDALKPPPPPPSKKEEKKGPLHAKTILDSDDDEAEADQAYLSELHDFAAKSRHKTNQIPLLIDKLSEKNDVKKFYSGLHDLLEYLPKKWVPVHEITSDLVARVVNLENKFNIPQFQLHRQKILEVIFYRRPELISYAVRLMLSPSIEMPDRYFVLQAMIGAANYISTGKGLEEATKEAQQEMEEIKKESALEKFETTTLQGDERVGKLLRASQSLLKEEKEKSAATTERNLYLEYAPQFVYPLIQEEVEGLHLDFTVANFVGFWF
uniref:Telomere length regulation protein conserved domain-containing protein n=1 Tax=Panagrolaimus superbus TaxID=310955 RepID=A0A914YRP6_9BILA